VNPLHPGHRVEDLGERRGHTADNDHGRLVVALER
jgi:hypothetical protein